MGQVEINPLLKKSKDNLNTSNLILLNKLGKGCIGKVYRVQVLSARQILALKIMSKESILQKGLLPNVFQEKEIWSSLYHSFIVNMYVTFQDAQNLYIIMDYIPNGDLRLQMQCIPHFSEDQIKFIASNIIIGLAYIHSQGIVHKDIKPENIVCDGKGYVRITDFGISKKINWDISREISGTIEYMALEIVKHNSLMYVSDYFSLGVLIYEMCFRKKPYIAADREEMFNQITGKNLDILKENDKGSFGYSKELCNLITGLLEKDHTKRLGKNGVNDFISHPFFKDFEWKKVKNKLYASSLKWKQIEGNNSYSYNLNANNNNSLYKNDDCIKNYEKKLNEETNKQFNGYNFSHFISQSDIKNYFEIMGMKKQATVNNKKFTKNSVEIFSKQLDSNSNIGKINKKLPESINNNNNNNKNIFSKNLFSKKSAPIIIEHNNDKKDKENTNQNPIINMNINSKILLKKNSYPSKEMDNHQMKINKNPKIKSSQNSLSNVPQIETLEKNKHNTIIDSSNKSNPSNNNNLSNSTNHYQKKLCISKTPLKLLNNIKSSIVTPSNSRNYNHINLISYNTNNNTINNINNINNINLCRRRSVNLSETVSLPIISKHNSNNVTKKFSIGPLCGNTNDNNYIHHLKKSNKIPDLQTNNIISLSKLNYSTKNSCITHRQRYSDLSETNFASKNKSSNNENNEDNSTSSISPCKVKKQTSKFILYDEEN